MELTHENAGKDNKLYFIKKALDYFIGTVFCADYITGFRLALEILHF